MSGAQRAGDFQPGLVLPLRGPWCPGTASSIGLGNPDDNRAGLEPGPPRSEDVLAANAPSCSMRKYEQELRPLGDIALRERPARTGDDLHAQQATSWSWRHIKSG